jgi:hypothetical protein
MDAFNFSGVYWWVWCIILVAVYLFYYFFNSWWQHRANVQKSEGKILCLFHTMGGEAFWKWCFDDKGELSPADKKGYDKRASELSKKAIGRIKAEKQQFGWYFILPDHVFQIMYPFTAPKGQQISIRIAEYVENYPAPRITANIEKWDAEQYAAVTSQMAMLSKDTTDLEAIISQAAGIEETLRGLMEMPSDVRMVKYLSMGNLGVGFIVGFLVFQLQGLVGKIAAQYGISAVDAFFKILAGS